MFLTAASREVYVDWEKVAVATVGALRLATGRHPEDEALASLIGELSIRSDQFRTLWAGRNVLERTHGVKRLRNALVGELTLHYENFELPGGAGQRMVTFTAEPSSPAHTALELLSLWTAPDDGGSSVSSVRHGETR